MNSLNSPMEDTLYQRLGGQGSRTARALRFELIGRGESQSFALMP